MSPNRRRYVAGGMERLWPDELKTGTPAARALAVPDRPGRSVARLRGRPSPLLLDFPDAFFVSERARVYLDPKKEKQNAGRLLERRLPQHDGVLPRRRARSTS